MMQMYFYWGWEATILFKWWQTQNWIQFMLSCLIIFIMAFSTVWLRYLKATIEYFWQNPQIIYAQGATQPGTRVHNQSLITPTRSYLSSTSSLLVPRRPIPWTRNLVRALFTSIIMTLDYSLMLCAMTFNAGIFIAVVMGFCMGALCFGHTLFKTTDDETVAPCCASMH